MKKNVFLLSLFLFVFAWMGSSFALDDLKVQTPRHKSKLSFLTLNENKVLVSVLNEENEAILGLQKEDFHITRGPKTAQIISVEDVAEQRDQGLNIVLVVDNSYSMKMRKAIGPVLGAMDEFLSLVRPIDDVHVITFTDPGTPQAGKPRVSSRITQSGDSALLSLSLKESYADPTDGTYLYEAMQEGLKIIRGMPEKSQKFMVIFSDGEDINSIIKPVDLQLASAGLKNFTVFAVDYMDKPGLDPFLQSFAEGTGGKIRKARSASDFLPIFKQFSTTIFHRYGVTFRFLNPPTGTLTSEPATVNIEEITIVDSSPFLNYVYFDTGSSEISQRYATFTQPGETEGFAMEKLKDTMEKYHHILNVIGRRMVENPDALITIVGCNSNTGEEKGRLDLSRSRADKVFAYLRYVWGIDPSRMEVKAQNLPSVPSTSRVPEGVVENQRVEIYSIHPAILDTINSTYTQEECDTSEIRIVPAIESETVIDKWQFRLLGGGNVLLTREGTGKPPESFAFDIKSLGVHNVALMKQISAEMDGVDNEGNTFSIATALPTRINFLKREERIAQKLESRVIEKYGLILFEFDRADLKDRNQVIVNRVITRMAQLNSASMDIAGHTDIIGKEDYNIKLSERRASAVYGSMLETGIAVGSQITYAGNGPNNPPYDNNIPEGRALNRTVIITLMYTENGE
ncbi:MAG: VWA domain-containing protein [Desulfurivibrio sp.]|nr:MAG: VWA domain-containing protein [Desulfurivibrio sp.]